MGRFKTLLSNRRTILLVVSLVLLVAGFLDHYSPLVFDGPIYRHPAPNTDAALFEHIGWYMTQGAVPYVDIWDIKPPFAAFELTYLVSLLAGGNPYVTHSFHLVFMAALWIGSILLIGEILEDVVESPSFAPLIGALVPLVYPAYYLEPLDGFRAKPVVVFLGGLSLLLMLRRKFFWAGLVSALVGWTWQAGTVFALIVGVEAYRSSDARSLPRALAGLVVASVVVLLPIVAWGAFLPMIVEAVIVPAVIGHGIHPWERLLFAYNLLGLSTLLVAAGFIGSFLAAVSRPKHWWIPFGFVVFFVYSVLLDLDSYADLIPFMLFTGLAVGCLCHRLRRRSQRIVLAIVLLLIPLNAFNSSLPGVGSIGTGTLDTRKITASLGRGIHYGPLRSSFDGPGEITLRHHGDYTMSELFWHTIRPDSCHYRGSTMEFDWMDFAGWSVDEKRCGDLTEKAKRKLLTRIGF